MKNSWCNQTPLYIAEKLKTNLETGLSIRQARLRLEEKGLNKLAEEQRESLWVLFSRQFNDFMVMVLMITTVVSAILGEVTDAVVILAIILMNAVLGFVQERRAEESLEALKQLTAPVATVIRDNRQININADQLVPGDILVLKREIEADARISVSSLFVNEATLRVNPYRLKKWGCITKRKPTIGRSNKYGFMGTLVTAGRGYALVVATEWTQKSVK